MKYIRETYRDWPEFVAAIKDQGAGNWRTGAAPDSSSDPGWHGTDTMEQALEFSTNGDPRVLATLPAILAKAQSLTIRKPAPAKKFDVAGGYAIVPRALAGNPLSMVRRARSARAQCPVLRLLINQSALADVNGRDRMNRGMAILAHAQAIQESGIQCQIDLVWCAENGDEQHRIDCRVKEAGGLFDLTTLSFAIANHATHRRFAFARRVPHWGTFMGSTRDIKEEERETGVIYYPAIREDDTQWRTLESAVQYIEGFTTSAREANSQIAA